MELTTTIRAPAANVFDLCLDVEAHTASMAGSRERIVDGVRSGRLSPGDTVTWTARHFGVPWRMTVRIIAYDRPHRFVDEQVRGPFQHWRHEHRFVPHEATGTTVMHDLIDFASPLGPLGRAVDAVVLGRYMRRLVENRNVYLARSLESRHG